MAGHRSLRPDRRVRLGSEIIHRIQRVCECQGESAGCWRVCFYIRLGSNIWKLVKLFFFLTSLEVPDGGRVYCNRTVCLVSCQSQRCDTLRCYTFLYSTHLVLQILKIKNNLQILFHIHVLVMSREDF